MNKALRILLAGDTSVIQSSKVQALRVAKRFSKAVKLKMMKQNKWLDCCRYLISALKTLLG